LRGGLTHIPSPTDRYRSTRRLPAGRVAEFARIRA
jgi:hypothetical protein